jgi:hypothetical protein
MKNEKTRRQPGPEKDVISKSLYHKGTVLDWLILVVVVLIAGVVIALSFGNTTTLATELSLNPYLVAGLVEILFASLLFIRGKQRALRRNVPLFLEIGYFVSLGFITAVNMYGLSKENPVIGPVVGLAISGAMWLMESVLVWLWTKSHEPHRKSMKERLREAKKQIKEMKLIQKIEWMKWEAEKPDLALIRMARKADKKREKVIGDELPAFFRREPGEIREVYPIHGETAGDIAPALADHWEKVPDDRENAPDDRENVPGDRENVPGDRENVPGDSPILLLAPPPSPVEIVRAIEKREKKRPGRRRLAREAGITEHEARMVLDALKAPSQSDSKGA